MEYDPVKGVQFWAYDGTGAYLALPKLDSQGPKPIPDICMACHFGTYSGQPSATVIGAVFLPFDLDSFLDDTGTPFPSSAKVTSTVQQQFHALNNMMVDARGTPGVIELVNQLWYPGGTGITAPFVFNRKAAQLPAPPPFIETVGVNHINHEPLYDNVVREVCRTCHVAITGKEWDKFAQMSGESGFIQSLACAPTLKMPHAEVPWIRYWQESMPSTLASELSFPSPGCPNQ
jgi:hypothetical protein